MNLASCAEDGYFAPKRIAAELRTTVVELARTVGLGGDAVQLVCAGRAYEVPEVIDAEDVGVLA